MPRMTQRQHRSATFATTRENLVQVVPRQGEFLSLSRATVVLPNQLSCVVDGTISFGTVSARRNTIRVQPVTWLSTSPFPSTETPEEWDWPFPEVKIRGDYALPLQFIGGEILVPTHDLNATNTLHIGVGLLCLSATRSKPVTLFPPPIAVGKVWF